jgi:hypothetical protein
MNRFRFPSISLAVLLIGSGLSAHAGDPVVFETIRSPAFVGWGPGADGFIGTGDDVADANNTAGTTTYEISPMALLLLYAESTTTIRERFAFENGTSTIVDFDTTGSLVPGFTFVDADTDRDMFATPLPHELVTRLDGSTDGEYYVAYCIGTAPCIPHGDVFDASISAESFVHHSGRGAGFLLRRGEDPFSLPGISVSLASYLEMLTGIVPSEWTAIAIRAGGRLDCANWDPSAFGFLASTEADTRALFALLDPSYDEVATVAGDFFVYRNFAAVETFNAAPNQVRMNVTQLLDGPGGTPGSFVGIQFNALRIQPDLVCQFETAGSLITPSGAGTLPAETWRSRRPETHLSAIGGVVATFSTSLIDFDFLPTPVEIDVAPGSIVNWVDPSGPNAVPVAILGSPSFDVSEVDPATLEFGPGRAAALQHAIAPGANATFQRVDFSGESFPDPSGRPPAMISGTLGVYDVPAGTTLVPVSASSVELTATGTTDSDGVFGGWKSVLGTVNLDFTEDPPRLVGRPPSQLFTTTRVLEDGERNWHIHPAAQNPSFPPQPGTELFDRRVQSIGDSYHGPIVLAATPVPAPDALFADYSAADTGLSPGDTLACVTGELFDGTAFEGCDTVIVPEPSAAAMAAACLLVLSGIAGRSGSSRRRRDR